MVYELYFNKADTHTHTHTLKHKVMYSVEWRHRPNSDLCWVDHRGFPRVWATLEKKERTSQAENRTCKYREGWSSKVENGWGTAAYHGLSRNRLEDAKSGAFGLSITLIIWRNIGSRWTTVGRKAKVAHSAIIAKGPKKQEGLN